MPLQKFEVGRTPEITLYVWARILNYYFDHLNTEYSVTLTLLDDIIKSSHIDWGSGTDQIDATDIPIQDSTPTGIYTATQVNAALLEVMNLLLDHNTRHENGGDDEISVSGLSGELADAQTPKAHTIESHSAAGVGDYGKYVKANSSTGAIEFSVVSGGSTYYEPVTDGDPYNPELIFDVDGDVVMVEVSL